jgi:hypothetical protein
VERICRTRRLGHRVKKMQMALPGELPVYQTLPGPLATQQGALVGKEGVGPAMGKRLE